MKAVTARGRRVLVGLLAVGVMAGCQGSDPTVADFGGESTDGSSPASATDSTSTANGATATDSATDTASGPGATDGSAGPTSTLDTLGLATAEEQIRAVVQNDWQIWIECSAGPTACDPAARLAEVRTTTGAYYTDNVALLRQWATKGQLVRQPDGRPDNNFVITESVVVAPDGTSATAVTCTGDGRALYAPGTGGALTVVEGSDAQGYNRAENYLVLDGTTWKIDGFKILEESILPEGKVLCQR